MGSGSREGRPTTSHARTWPAVRKPSARASRSRNVAGKGLTCAGSMYFELLGRHRLGSRTDGSRRVGSGHSREGGSMSAVRLGAKFRCWRWAVIRQASSEQG